MSYTKGFKAFYKTDNEKEGRCRDFTFAEGETYEIEGDLILCENGFHFCKDLVLTFEYYGYDTSIYCFAEVEALGEMEFEQPTKHKCCTSKIKILRFLSDSEVLKMIDGHRNSGNENSGHRNSGDENSGHLNSGNRNSGNCNSGDWNSGNRNSGNCNSGNRNSGNENSGHLNSGDENSGNRNSGNCNSGNENSGNCNSGNRNSGNCNSGDWNSCNFETGFFNSEQSNTIRVFNKGCERKAWEDAKKPNFLFFDLIDGKSYKESFQAAFENAASEDVELLKALPNFDSDVFYEISGIRV